jgi:hypothetical protein
MFSSVERESTLDGLRLFGLTDEAVPREIPLLSREMLAPFDQTRLSTAFSRTLDDDARRPFIAELLEDCLTRYERRRANGTNRGPRLRAVRLYDVHWTLDPKGTNAESPDTRRLVAEVERDQTATSRF